jgi:hypothetical protein
MIFWSGKWENGSPIGGLPNSLCAALCGAEALVDREHEREQGTTFVFFDCLANVIVGRRAVQPLQESSSSIVRGMACVLWSILRMEELQ